MGSTFWEIKADRYEDFAAFFRLSAQRFFIIAEMRFLAAGLIRRRRRDADLPFPAAAFRALLAPLSEAKARSMRSLSCSSSPIIVSMFKGEPPSQFYNDILQQQVSAAT
jgi:hypothetical protein